MSRRPLYIAGISLLLAAPFASQAFSDENPNSATTTLGVDTSLDEVAKASADDVATACGRIWAPTHLMAAKDGILCAVIPKIDERISKTFVSLLGSEKILWVVVVSPGGDVGSSLDMGDAISRTGAGLVIPGPCVSSCASHLFLAAKVKYVVHGGTVGWHGGIPVTPTSPDDPAGPLIARNNEFFTRLGVNRDLFEKYPNPLRTSHVFAAQVEKGKRPFWTYSKEELERDGRVQGIAAYWFPQYDEWVKDALQTEGIFRLDHEYDSAAAAGQ